jgi:diketogulonate reductase-like aldo/keto reductase
VSNFDLDDMVELFDLGVGAACAANQVLYNPQHRGIEFNLLSWCRGHAVPVMAYCPVGQGGALLQHPAILEVARRQRAGAAQVCLAWALRQPGVLAIPKAVDPQHLRSNAAASELVLSEEELAILDGAFPPPTRKQPLAMI